MGFVIVTGMSGAGKSQAVHALEDIGYYCVDNLPPRLLEHFFQLEEGPDGAFPEKIAIVADSRGGEMFSDLFLGLERLQQRGYEYRILFLDARDDVIINRYKETRRKHPLLDEENPSMEEALRHERRMLRQARDRADYVIDTSLLSAVQLQQQVTALFLQDDGKMMIACSSFGFKYGIPSDADLVFDVRCLTNPFYIPELKDKTGLDEEVRDFVFSHPQARELFDKIWDLLALSIPMYEKEGKRQLVIAFGCTGGKHRSVSFAWKTAGKLRQLGENVFVNHRDIRKGKTQ